MKTRCISIATRLVALTFIFLTGCTSAKLIPILIQTQTKPLNESVAPGFDAALTRNNGSDDASFDYKVTFPRPFAKLPDVSVAFAGYWMEKNPPNGAYTQKVMLSAKDISPTGFTLHIERGAFCVLTKMAFSYTAVETP